MPRRFLNGISIPEVDTLPDPATNVGALLRQAGRVRCSNGTAWVDLEATGAGTGGTITRYEIDFGSGASALMVDVAVPGVTAGQAVVATLSLDMPAGIAPDELEMDPLTVAAHAVGAGVVRVLVTSADPITGKRAINIMR